MKKITIEAIGETVQDALAHVAQSLAMAISEPPVKSGDQLSCSSIFGGSELKLETFKEKKP